MKILGYEWSGEKQSMDPADMHSGDDAYHTFAVYNRLVDIDDNFNVLPELATEWSVSEDGLTWTFKLREGVKFHSGKDFSSADVVWSFKRLLDEKTGSGARAVLEFLDPDGITRAGRRRPWSSRRRTRWWSCRCSSPTSSPTSCRTAPPARR